VDEIDHQAVASKVKKIIALNSGKKKVKFENLHSALDYFKVQCLLAKEKTARRAEQHYIKAP
jgi:hypothetical protein